MEPIKKIVSPINDQLVIELPIEYANSESYEVIAFPVIDKIKKSRIFGYGKGKISMDEKFNDPIEDFKSYQ